MLSGGFLLIQLLNGLQFGITLFLFTAGLTLVLGIMGLMNLAHASFYMLGAYYAVAFSNVAGSFLLGAVLAAAATFVTAVIVEWLVLGRLYDRDHLDQVLATFGLVLFANEAIRMVWGSAGLSMSLPSALSWNVTLWGGAQYPAYRVAIIAIGCATAAGLFALVAYTRLGMLIRAAADKPEMLEAVGVDVRWLCRAVVGLGAALAALAGAVSGPLFAIEPGMGDSMLVLALVTIVIGGLGSIRGSFFAALIIGVVDAVGRTLLPSFLASVVSRQVADSIGPAVGSMLIYLLMIFVLLMRPQGLFGAKVR